MDPKAANANFPNHLDPKLKEAYERVMGTATTKQEPNPAQPMPATQAPPASVPTQPPASPAATPPPTPIASYQVPSLQPANSPFAATTLSTSKTTPVKPSAKPTVSEKKSSPIMTILLVLGGIIFFLAYTIVCVKLLNVTLPFPLPF